MKTLLSKWHPNRKIGKFLKNILIGVGIVLFLAFLILPFCRFSDEVTRICKWFWLGCAFINLDNFADYKTAREQKIVCPITALYIILILVYLYTYWHFLSLPIVICGSIIIGIIEFTISISIYKTVRFTDKQKLLELPSKMIHGIQLGGLYICSLALFLLGIFESTLLLYIFGGIALLLLAVSILMSLSSGLSVKNNVFNLIAFVVDVLSFLALVIYLIYVIPEEFANLQSIITTIVAAVLGGALTLAGVAWTIRRQDDLHRRDEKSKNKPMFRYCFGHPNIKDYIMVFCFEGIQDKKSRDFFHFDYVFKNFDNANFILEYIIVNEIKIYPQFDANIGKNEYFIIRGLCEEGKIVTKYLISVRDVLGNNYMFELLFDCGEPTMIREAEEK